jgi:hypothetical protein
VGIAHHGKQNDIRLNEQVFKKVGSAHPTVDWLDRGFGEVVDLLARFGFWVGWIRAAIHQTCA